MKQGYSLQLVNGPTEEPVSLPEAKAHLRVTDTAEDDLIEGLIVAARLRAENFTRRGFISQQWRMYLDAFPALDLNALSLESWRLYPDESRAGDLILPMSRLITLDSIIYLDFAGQTQTLAGSNYVVDQYREPPRVGIAFAKLWPVTYPQAASVKVLFTVGYGADAKSVPETLKLAIKMLVAHWYENREPIITEGAVPQELPEHVKALLWTERVLDPA